MCRRRGFTLVELLVVLSIISLLMAIMTASLEGARRRARETACQSNLRQWGIVFAMYTGEHDGKLIHSNQPAWYYPIRHYYGDVPQLLACPSVKKVSNPEGFGELPYGGSFLSWGRFFPESAGRAWDSSGSYGLNQWAYPGNQQMHSSKSVPGPEGSASAREERSASASASADGTSWSFSWSFSWSTSSGSSWSYASYVDANEAVDSSRYWTRAHGKNLSNIPLVLDCWWLYGFCCAVHPPPIDDAIPRVDLVRGGNLLCVNRHNGGIGIVFLDASVRKVGLKELWTLKWYPQYNTAGPWTKAGGVQPYQWPKWLRRFKDY